MAVAPGSDDGEDTRSIAQLYAELTAYLDDAWGRSHQVWVFGEVQKYADHRSGHCYLDLVDPSVTGRDAPTLKAKCWRSTWGPLKASLATAGLTLEEGSVLRVRGYVDVYAPRGELGFIITAVDVEALRLAALGEHARRREELIKKLTAEGLLDTNRALPTPAVPLRVGLVASAGTEGYNDFVGMLDASGFAFRVTLARASVQGARAAAEVVGALAALSESGCDVICVVRGGGSTADLAAFDDELVARAIANCPIPVFTGIGHTGDVSVADLVAATSFRTPTACAEGLAVMVRDWYASNVAAASARAAAAASALLEESADSIGQARRHLGVVGRHRLARARDGLSVTIATISRRSPVVLDVVGARTALRARRIAPLAERGVSRAADGLASRRALLSAYDPRRLMQRGWSITTTAEGVLVRSVASVSPGSALVTRLADGVARSTVTGVETDAG